MRGLCLRASQTPSPLTDRASSSLKPALKTTSGSSSSSSPSPYFMIIAQAFLLLYVPMHAQDLLEEFIFSQDGSPNGEFEELLELVEPVELASMLQKAFVSLKVELIAAGVLKDDSELLQSTVRFAARPGRPPKNPAPAFPPGSSLIEQANLGQPGETGCKRPWALLTGEEAVPKKRGRRSKADIAAAAAAAAAKPTPGALPSLPPLPTNETEQLAAIERVGSWPHNRGVEVPHSPFYPFLLPGLALDNRPIVNSVASKHYEAPRSSSDSNGGAFAGNGNVGVRKFDLVKSSQGIAGEGRADGEVVKGPRRRRVDDDDAVIVDGKGDGITVARRQKKNRKRFRVFIKTEEFPLHGRVSRFYSTQSTPNSVSPQLVANSATKSICTLTSVTPRNSSEGEGYYISLKGVDVLSNYRYRVQLNTFQSQKRKFSRNSNDIYENFDQMKTRISSNSCTTSDLPEKRSSPVNDGESNPFIGTVYEDIYSIFSNGQSLEDHGKSCLAVFSTLPSMRHKLRLVMEKESMRDGSMVTTSRDTGGDADGVVSIETLQPGTLSSINKPKSINIGINGLPSDLVKGEGGGILDKVVDLAIHNSSSNTNGLLSMNEGGDGHKLSTEEVEEAMVTDDESNDDEDDDGCDDTAELSGEEDREEEGRSQIIPQ
eukprot:scaffold3296_cov159-Ochromonas_danica.AAC.7